MSASTGRADLAQMPAGQEGNSSDSQPKSWAELRREPVPASNEGFRVEHIKSHELHAYASESWWTAEGARIKARRLQQAGLPDFTNWRLLTVTGASRSISPQEAYNLGKSRMRRFLARLRKALGKRFRWCWKLEFHEDGYPHWHLLIEYLERIPVEMLAELESWWGLGRVNVRRVNHADIRYVFKYVAKGPEDVPMWVANHKGSLRVFQACQGFYTCRKTRKAKRAAPSSCLVRVNLFTRLGWDKRKALLVLIDDQGNRRVRAVKLRVTFNALLLTRAYESIQKRVQLAPPGVVNISWLQAQEIQHEHRKFAGLAGIPKNAAYAA
jgi:hypothetical protein